MDKIVRNIILTVCTLVLLAVVWCGSNTVSSFARLKNGLNSFRQAFTEDFSWREELIDLNGWAAKKLHMDSYYNDIGIFVGKDGMIRSPGAQTSTDYEFEEMILLKEFLDRQGIALLYVNEPTKYGDDSEFENEFGVQSFSNRNADRLLERLQEAGIATLDLRKEAAADGIRISDLFYGTDHHWTTPAALWASEKISRALNEQFGFQNDLSVYEPDQFTYRNWKNCWLGEQGEKLAVTFTGLDDFTEIKPAFPVSYTFKNGGNPFEGTFDDFVDESYYIPYDDGGRRSWHYSYKQRDVINHQAKDGKILMLTDSYDQTTVPFLSLSVGALDCLTMRDYPGDIPTFMEGNDYDTVVVCYACFMIGAHDNPGSSNYRMFSFL